MSAGRFFAGIDGGGSKTEIVVVDATGAERARLRTSTCNQSVIGRDAAIATLQGGLREAARLAGTEPPFDHAWFGLAGFDRGEDHHLMAPALGGLAVAFRLTNDAELALAALPEGIGLVIIAGTGSIAVGRDHTGASARAGGWGHVFGDEGSGYELGRRALQAAAMMADGRGPATSLLSSLLAHWQLSGAPQLITRVYGGTTSGHASKGEIAALADHVVAAAAEGDQVALALIDEAAHDLAVTGIAVANRLDFADPLPLALAGGLLINIEPLRQATIRRIEMERPVGAIAIVTDPALAGARAAIHLAEAAAHER